MSNIHKSLTELIGNTPMLELTNYCKKNNLSAKIVAKLEYFNPLSSVKDRVGFEMISTAEKEGKINSDTVIIEPTSGNTGIGLAFIAACKGYKIILTMPETMSIERRKLLSALGAEIVLSDGMLGMQGAIEKAIELKSEIKNSFIPQQFENPSNPESHRKTTALEILNDTDKNIDFFVAGVGTGGTITGIGEVLKENIKNIKIIAVEPNNSAVLSGKKPGFHAIQGIGAGFIPKILNTEIYDEIITCPDINAKVCARSLAKTEGVLAGISSGAALFAATEIAKKEENRGKTIVVLFPDSGERYLSTDLFD